MDWDQLGFPVDEKTVAAVCRKRLEKQVGKREANRLIADKMCWDRLTELGQTPIYTPKPRLL